METGTVRFARGARTLAITSLALAMMGVVVAQGGGDAKSAPATANKYIGAEKCKSCHQSEAAGNQYTAWLGTKHSKAWERLASDDAKASGKKLGVDDPQKSDKCLKCHTTAFGVAADLVKKGFEPKGGVQCESCHGPGEKHMKARFAAAAGATAAEPGKRQPVPEGEIIARIDEKTCLTCHNSESPNYKPFCFCEYFPKMRHLDPRKTDAEKHEYVCSCDKCKAANGGQPGKCSFPADAPKK